jgi:agmatinase
MRGPARAPEQIRASYFSDSSNLWSENGLDLGSMENLYDLGDICFHDGTDEMQVITDSVRQWLDLGCCLICLGGDHSVTFPVIAAWARKFKDLNILHLDAHPDLYDDLDGNPWSHASPFARIMEKRLAKRLVQAGIRTMNNHQREQAAKFKVEVNEMKNGNGWLEKLRFDGPVYLSIDMDCLDPAFGPGVSHHEPGGMTTREVIDIIHHFKGRLIGADIVETNPERDVNSMTAMVAAKFLKEVIARIHQDTLKTE